MCLGLSDIDKISPEKRKYDVLKFKNKNFTFKHPFYVTADFQSTLKKLMMILIR